MNFEYEIRLKDGRTIAVVGVADVVYSCDCGQDNHDHIESIEIESAVEVTEGGESWLEVEDSVIVELESKIENRLYSELEEECA
jgi:hypothetical protein